MIATLQGIEGAGQHSFAIGSQHLIVGLISGVVTFVCVFLHYEAMSVCSMRIHRSSTRRRMRVFVLMLAMLAAHVVEVWIFALVYWALEAYPGLGVVQGAFEEGALDLVYFSVVNYTTVGYGDMTPTGALRILAGTEALVGLSLITWSASLVFLEMQRDWAEHQRGPA
ncbi:MAG: potassium channel family protein [Planctomycetota bacterium]